METTENKTKMAVIKEFVYEFKAKDKLPLDLSSSKKIFLVINDHETSIAIESLFVGEIDFDTDDVTGYSILQLITGGTQLKIDENTSLKITFIDKVSNREFYISKIRRPLFYDDDIEISPERRLKYIDLLLTTSMIPIEAQREEAERAAQEASRVAQEAEIAAQEAERKRIEEEDRLRVEAEKANIIGGEEWEEQRNDLIKEGFSEFIADNYRMFYKAGQADEPSEIGFFILSPGGYEFIQLYEEEITDEMEEYSFEDDKEDEIRVILNKADNKLTVDSY